MSDPLFWLGLSLLLVAVSLTALLIVAIPALRELARAARSAEKLCDLLSRELPDTLEAIRQTGGDVSELSEELATGIQSASRLAGQVDQELLRARQQARQAQVAGRSLWAGARAALAVLAGPSRRRRPPTRRPRPASSPTPQKMADLRNRERSQSKAPDVIDSLPE